MSAIVGRLLLDNQASTAIEYTLIAGLISIAAIGAMTNIGQKLVNLLGPIANAI